MVQFDECYIVIMRLHKKTFLSLLSVLLLLLFFGHLIFSIHDRYDGGSYTCPIDQTCWKLCLGNREDRGTSYTEIFGGKREYYCDGDVITLGETRYGKLALLRPRPMHIRDWCLGWVRTDGEIKFCHGLHIEILDDDMDAGAF